MLWRKLGLIYTSDNNKEWSHSHAMIPTPLQRGDKELRLFFASTDTNMVGRIGYFDLSLDNPQKILRASDYPVLDIGQPGAFDDNGVNASCVIPNDNNEFYLYYIGYQLHRQIPYTLFTNLAISLDGGDTFEKISEVPILDRAPEELFFRTAPFVIRKKNIWQMWYIGGMGWTEFEGKKLPQYNLRYIESKDGITWPGAGVICLEPNKEASELGFGRPFILQEQGIYRMWYSIRYLSGAYRLGYATSEDGFSWIRRDDEVGIGLSQKGWDSEMICYAAIVPYKNNYFMFYNGNGYGRTGIGLAILESD